MPYMASAELKVLPVVLCHPEPFDKLRTGLVEGSTWFDRLTMTMKWFVLG